MFDYSRWTEQLPRRNIFLHRISSSFSTHTSTVQSSSNTIPFGCVGRRSWIQADLLERRLEFRSAWDIPSDMNYILCIIWKRFVLLNLDLTRPLRHILSKPSSVSVRVLPCSAWMKFAFVFVHRCLNWKNCIDFKTWRTICWKHLYNKLLSGQSSSSLLELSQTVWRGRILDPSEFELEYGSPILLNQMEKNMMQFGVPIFWITTREILGSVKWGNSSGIGRAL